MGPNSLKIGYFNENSLLIPCITGISRWRRVRFRLPAPPAFARFASFGSAGQPLNGCDASANLTDLGLIDEYRVYLHPVVLGRGKPFFAGPRPPLHLVASDRIGKDVIRLTYVPA